MATSGLRALVRKLAQSECRMTASKPKYVDGFIAYTVCLAGGEVCEYTDPMPTRAKARSALKLSVSWLSWRTITKTARFRGNPEHLYEFVNEQVKVK